jgi:branched-chain amino acid transport system substrate-binding protein
MAGGTVITSQFDPLVFQTPWSNTIVVPFVLDAMQKSGSSPLRIALVSDTGGYGKDGRAVILEELGGRGGMVELVADETFNPGDSDLTAQLTRVRKADPDALLVWTAGKEGAILLKNARDLGLEIPVFGGSGQARSEFVTGAGDAAEGFVFGTGRSLIPENWGEETAEYSAVAEFAARYEDEFGEGPDIFAGHAYDAINILSEALSGLGDDVTPQNVREEIERTEELAGYGGSFTFSEDNHNGLTEKDLSLYRIEGGKWVTAD